MRCAAGYTLEYGWCEPCSAPGTGKATRLSCATCVGLKRSQSCSSCMRDWDPETVGLGSFVDAKGACRPVSNCSNAAGARGECCLME